MVAIIPARGGSKGLPGKNIKSLCGKPLIVYTIEAAIKAKEIDKVIVTTDSQEIAAVARDYGAEVPFMRPEYLADDNASAVDVYIHAVEYMMKDYSCDMQKFIVLLPTAPLRDEKDIDDAVRKFREKNATTLISVTEADVPASWYYRMSGDGAIKNAGFDRENTMRNRQMNDQYYIPNGAIYILDYQLLKNQRTYYTEDTLGYIMPRKKSIDIDSIDDFEYVEYLMNQRIKTRQ